MQGVFSKTWFRIAAMIAIAVTILIAANWPTVAVTSAVASSERRPALLNDASWNDPESAERFYDRFGNNPSDDELVSWLEQNGFDIDRDAQVARKRVQSLPCNENIEVAWSLSATGSVTELNAIISAGGCL